MSLEELKNYLKNEGWAPCASADGVVYPFAKIHDTSAGCLSNHPGEGKIQVVLDVYVWTKYVQDKLPSFQLSIRGQLHNNRWVDFTIHALPEDIAEALKEVPRLIACWETAAQYTL